LLPPEIRYRIYSFVFGDLIIRVNFGSYHVCQSSQACELQRRQNYDQRISYHPEGDPNLISEDSGFMDCQTQRHVEIPVHLLQVCRQIYHEAALKPFSEPTFDFRAFDLVNPRRETFTKKLVPAQARAIAHMRARDGSIFRPPSKGAVFNLRGLKHVEVHFEIYTGRVLEEDEEEDHPMEDLAWFKRQGAVAWLKNMGLKSIRLTVMAVGKTPTEEALASIFEWMKREEDEILSH
jgi:hypothetical protein